MKNVSLTVASVLVAALTACGGAPAAKTPDAEDGAGSGAGSASSRAKTAAIASKAQDTFKDALADLVAMDKAVAEGSKQWSEGECEDVADDFLDASKQQGKGKFPEALYNAGLAFHRCGKKAEAKEQFEAALKVDPKFHRARTQLALYAYASSPDKLDEAIRQLDQAVDDAQFQNVEALVARATLRMKRNSSEKDSFDDDDMAGAKKDLQRALAIDDAYMPALNQLALYYFEAARAKAAKEPKKKGSASSQAKANSQALELAALVCSQAMQKNDRYAPIYNTAGMIQVELRNLNLAVQFFQKARKLDPKFFEAQMNFAAVNLNFRGFEQAAEAYEGALKIRPNDYDAHLGLALARRGLIGDANYDEMLGKSASELAAAKKIAPERPETYFNEAILTQEFKAKSGAEADLLAAKTLFKAFMDKAGSAPEFAEAVKQSKDRMGEIDQMIEFSKQSEEERKRSEAEQKQREAEAEAKGQTEAEPKPAAAEGGP